jgi:dienelactone hydrolase
MRRVDVQIPAADGHSNGTLHVPAGDGPWPGVLVFPDAGGARETFRQMGDRHPTFDTQASERHWAALGSLYRSRLRRP